MAKYLKENFTSILSVLVLGFLWELVSFNSNLKFLFSSPTNIFRTFVDRILDLTLVNSFLITGFEALLGFIIGNVLGILFAFLAWYFPSFHKIIKPYIFIFGAIPAFAFAPLFIIWVGIGIPMKIFVASLGVFLVSFGGAFEATKQFNNYHYKILQTYGASKFTILKKLIMPSAFDRIISTSRTSINVALFGAFVGEFISSNDGIGHFILRSASLYDTSSVFAGSITLLVLSFMLTALVYLVEINKRKLIKKLFI